MLIKFLCSVETDKDTRYSSGTVIDVSDALAERLIKSKLAEKVNVASSTVAAGLRSGGTDDEMTVTELKTMTVAELSAVCEGKGIEVPSGANKTLLINLLTSQ